MSHRLFVGIDLPAAIKETLHSFQNGLRDARWVPIESLHLTLRFIGEVERAEAEEIDQALSMIRSSTVDITLKDAGAFGSGSRARVLWAGVVRSRELSDLKNRIDGVLTGAGLEPDDRKFAPHVTLARFRNGSARAVDRRAAELAPLISGHFLADEFVLFESTLGSSGAHYQRAAAYPLSST